jgi:putative (di)nucleoside polyphosphate hydrolase
MQRWFAFRFLGSDDEINIATEHPEFRDWKWVDLENIPAQTVEFKRSAYEEIRDGFREVTERLKSGSL